MSSRNAIMADAAVGDASKKKKTKKTKMKKENNSNHHQDHERHRNNRCINDDNKHDDHNKEVGPKALKCLVRGCPKLICPQCFDDILENDLDIDRAFQRHSSDNNNNNNNNNNEDDDDDDDAIISEDDNQNGNDDDAPPPLDVEQGRSGAARPSRRDDDKEAPKQPKKRKALVGTSAKDNVVGGAPSSSSGPAEKRRRSSSPVHPTISRTDSISSLSGNSAFDESSRSSNKVPRLTAQQIVKYMMQMFRDHEERKASVIRRLEREKELALAQQEFTQTQRLATIKAAQAEFDYTLHLQKIYEEVKEKYADQGYDYIAQIFPQVIVFFPDEELSEDQKKRFTKVYNEWNKAHGLHCRIDYST
jgi:hypothetical protein